MCTTAATAKRAACGARCTDIEALDRCCPRFDHRPSSCTRLLPSTISALSNAGCLYCHAFTRPKTLLDPPASLRACVLASAGAATRSPVSSCSLSPPSQGVSPLVTLVPFSHHHLSQMLEDHAILMGQASVMSAVALTICPVHRSCTDIGRLTRALHACEQETTDLAAGVRQGAGHHSEESLTTGGDGGQGVEGGGGEAAEAGSPSKRSRSKADVGRDVDVIKDHFRVLKSPKKTSRK